MELGKPVYFGCRFVLYSLKYESLRDSLSNSARASVLDLVGDSLNFRLWN